MMLTLTHKWGLVAVLGVLLCAGQNARAQAEVPLESIPDSISSDLQFTANRMAQTGRLPDAVPYLEELIRRYEASKGARFEKDLERFYFLLGAAFMEMQSYDDAIEILTKYVSRFDTAADAPTVLEWLGDCYRINGDHAGAAAAYKRLRQNYNLRGVVLDEVMAKESGSLAVLEKWDEAVPLLTELMATSRSPMLKGQAATLLVRAHLALDEVGKIIELLPQLLSISQARYDVDFNLMLIHGGDAKYHQGDFNSALLLYQLVLTKEELIAWHEEQIADLEDALRNRTQALDFKVATGIRTRLKDLKSSLETILERGDFTEELLFRKGQTFFELGRKWEAFWTFWSIWKTLPQSDLTRQALYSAFVLAGELNMDDRAVEFGWAFIDAFGAGDYFDEVTLQLANLHLRRREFSEAIQVAETGRQINPEHAYMDRLVFIIGYSLFQQENLAEALAAFTEVREKFPDSESEEGAIYWIGMTYLFRQEYESARDEFSEFCARYIGGVYYEDARFRLGVADYGLGDFKSAREHFEKFIEQFPGSPLRAEAHAFLGDIAGAEGRLADALEHYRLVPKYTEDMQQINYAAFQVGKILELQERYADMVEFFTAYLQNYRLDGQYTEALHRLGFAQKMLGDVDGMLKTYTDAIRKYAFRIDALGIDLIIRDWVDASRTIKGEPPVKWLREQLASSLENRSDTARLRMLWALSDLCGAEAAPVFNDADLKNAPPAVLEWIGRVSARGQPELAAEALEKVVEEFPESPWVENALATWADIAAAAGDNEKALKLYQRQFESFPSSLRAGEALKKMADMKYALKRYDEAMADYLRVLEIKEWRGPLWPECLYKVGDVLLTQGKLKEAFGYFQRVYVLYEGYPDWAARAYLQSGIVLEKLNRRREALATYEEMLKNETYRELESGREAQQRLSALL